MEDLLQRFYKFERYYEQYHESLLNILEGSGGSVIGKAMILDIITTYQVNIDFENHRVIIKRPCNTHTSVSPVSVSFIENFNSDLNSLECAIIKCLVTSLEYK